MDLSIISGASCLIHMVAAYDQFYRNTKTALVIPVCWEICLGIREEGGVCRSLKSPNTVFLLF